MIQTPFLEGVSIERNERNQRVNEPLGIGAGNGEADCC
jgi:hypothetical protein